MFNLSNFDIMEAFSHEQYNLQYLFDKLPLGTVVTNRQGEILYFNQAQTQIDGLPAELALGKTEPELYDFLNFPDIAQICQKRGRPILGFMWLYRTILGKTVNAAFWVFPLFNKGEVVGAICFTQPLATSLLAFPSEKHPPIQWPEDEPIHKERTKIVGGNLIFQQAVKMAQTTAGSPSPVLIAGETGTGKEMFARYLHDNSPRAKEKFMAINCAAIPSNLLEGLLFGTTKGSFTGAIDRPGLFEEANGGTVYLDEIDSMPLELQPKLLRALQEMKVRRVGHTEEVDLDIKVVSSVGASLTKLLEKQALRPDLFYRLAVVIIEVPALRHRLDDLDELLNHFINKYNRQLLKKCCKFNENLMSAFARYDWPGNVRELEHVVAGAINLADLDDEVLDFKHLPLHYRRILEEGNGNPVEPADENWLEGDLPQGPLPQYVHSTPNGKIPPAFMAAADFKQHRSLKGQLSQNEKTFLVRALTESRGNVAEAARGLGISRQLLSYKMEKYGLSRRQFVNLNP